VVSATLSGTKTCAKYPNSIVTPPSGDGANFHTMSPPPLPCPAQQSPPPLPSAAQQSPRCPRTSQRRLQGRSSPGPAARSNSKKLTWSSGITPAHFGSPGPSARPSVARCQHLSMSSAVGTCQRGAEPDRFLSRRFFNLGGSFFRVPATTACFMSTQDLGVSIRSNHSSLPSSGARTTDPWQIF
jgi:hypothetical protein